MSAKFDLIVVGGGWAVSIVAMTACAAGLSVLLLERGEISRLIGSNQFYKLRVPGFPGETLQDTARETFTLRHNRNVDAFPIRSFGSFLVAQGIGGAGLLWGGVAPRFHPSSFTLASSNAEKLQRPWADALEYRDWPITYDDLEPFYTWIEGIMGVSTTDGLAPEAYYRSSPLRGQPLQLGFKNKLLCDAARSLGLDVREAPIAVSTGAYTNQLGIERDIDASHGYSLATPLNTVLPAAVESGRLTIVRGIARRIVHSSGRASGVIYHDGKEEVHVACGAVNLCAWGPNNVRTLLLSKIGTPYDPVTRRGTVGRLYANHIGVNAQGYLAKAPGFSPEGRLGGWAASDFDPISPANADYIGGARIHAMGLNSFQRDLPTVPPGSPTWGRSWQQNIVDFYGRSIHLGFLGEIVPHRERFLDLDPDYRDAWGDPLLRITFDWAPNERNMTQTMGRTLQEVLQGAGAIPSNNPSQLPEHYDTVHYTNSHATGGAIMGVHPEESVVDRDLRCWDVDNLWIIGSSAFPSSPAPNPTLTICALARKAAATIIQSLTGSLPNS